MWKDEWTGLLAAPERQEWEQVSVASPPPREACLRWGFTEASRKGHFGAAHEVGRDPQECRTVRFPAWTLRAGSRGRPLRAHENLQEHRPGEREERETPKPPGGYTLEAHLAPHQPSCSLPRGIEAEGPALKGAEDRNSRGRSPKQQNRCQRGDSGRGREGTVPGQLPQEDAARLSDHDRRRAVEEEGC